VWDSVAESLNSTIKFGKINVNQEEELLQMLPIKPKIFPLVYMWSPKQPYDILRIEEILNENSIKMIIFKILNVYVE